MTDNYITRSTIDCALQEFSPDKLSNVDVKNIRLFFITLKKVIDIGSLAFLVRNKKKTPNGMADLANVLVDLSSLNSQREYVIPNLIEEIKTQVDTGQLREITAFGKIRDVVAFIDWCDNNNFRGVMDDVKSGISAYKAYSAHLEHSTKINALSLHTAATYQENALFTLASIFGISKTQVSQGVRNIQRNYHAVNKTLPPSESAVSDVLALCKSFFDGACDFVINERKFPFKISLPKEDIWLLPTKPKFCATKEQLATRENWGMGQWAWNFELGVINSHHDIAEKYSGVKQGSKTARAKEMILKAQKALEYENENKRTLTRQKIASLANKCFLVLFFSNTGMNFTQAKNLRWSDDYSVKTSSIGFKAIKYRAQGKEIEFVIASQFLDTFKKYIQLRKLILQEDDYPFLLFTKEAGTEITNQLPNGILRQVTRDLRRAFYSNLEEINTREWRANKSDFHLRTTDISTTAMVLQNSEETVIRSYMEGSERDCASELSNYWRRLNEVVNFNRSNDSVEPTSIGNCKKPNTPIAESTTSPITPDCRQPEGCLFCNQYSVHADEEDLRKLHSLLYVINECTPLAKSIDHHNSVFGGIVKRIHSIITTIRNRSEALKELNESIERDVNVNENLSPYWEKKLSMLVAIGAL